MQNSTNWTKIANEAVSLPTFSVSGLHNVVITYDEIDLIYQAVKHMVDSHAHSLNDEYLLDKLDRYLSDSSVVVEVVK